MFSASFALLMALVMFVMAALDLWAGNTAGSPWWFASGIFWIINSMLADKTSAQRKELERLEKELNDLRKP